MSSLAFIDGSVYDAGKSDSNKNDELADDGDDPISSKEWDDLHNSMVAAGWLEEETTVTNAYGNENQSTMPEKRIVPFITVFDVIQKALYGTGRTETFCLRILEQLDYGLAECQALVLSSTRELALLLVEFIQALGEDLGVKVCACVGGKKNSIRKDQQSLSSGIHVVVGTPGRVRSLLTRHSLRPDHIKMFVLDETDQLLSCGYKDQICDTVHLLPSNIQICSFSATLCPEAFEMLRNFIKRPVKMFVKRNELAAEDEDGIRQFYMNVEKKIWKLNIICYIYETFAMSKSVIFVSSMGNVDWLAYKMRSKGHSVSATHRYMNQKERDSNIRDFQSGLSRFLITISTDLLACGTCLQQVSLVINYDFVPTENHDCLQDLRRGRFGRQGVVINFLTKELDQSLTVDDIQRLYHVIVFDELSLQMLHS